MTYEGFSYQCMKRLQYCWLPGNKLILMQYLWWYEFDMTLSPHQIVHSIHISTCHQGKKPECCALFLKAWFCFLSYHLTSSGIIRGWRTIETIQFNPQLEAGIQIRTSLTNSCLASAGIILHWYIIKVDSGYCIIAMFGG